MILKLINCSWVKYPVPHAHTHTFTHIHTHIHTYIHTQAHTQVDQGFVNVIIRSSEHMDLLPHVADLRRLLIHMLLQCRTTPITV